VQVEADAPPPPPSDDMPQLDPTLLEQAQAEHESHANETARPHLRAKGLDRDNTQKPLVYSAPELGEDAPAIQHSNGTGADTAKTGTSSAKRQQARRNPNRGSRGNKRKR
jgi:preprotein translocase subunit SecA